MGMWSSVCGNCKYWKQYGWSRNGECTIRSCTDTDFDDSCGNFEMGHYSEDDDSSESGSSDSGGCFITSMLCHVLGFDDHCDIMETLRGFRDVKMKQAGCYSELLDEYDTVGPKIAQAIEQDTERIALCQMLLDTYINPIVQMILSDQDQNAVEKYREMVLQLKTHYNI